MAIINDYDAIARRLRELNPATGKDDDLSRQSRNQRGGSIVRRSQSC